jgi:hypothetical protein
MTELLSPDAVLAAAKYDRENTIYESGKDQPRDAKGKFRVVLARIKENLGVSGLQRSLERAEELDIMLNAGNYKQAASSAQQLKSLLERLDTGALNSQSLENVRESARLLGEVMANLPLPFGQDNAKVKFSDLPPVLKDLIEEMTKRVEAKIGKEDADQATGKLRSYKGGGDLFSQREVSSEMSTLLRLLT